MNNDGRKRIDLIIKDVEAAATLRAEIDTMIEALNEKIGEYRDVFRNAHSMIEELRDEEQEKFDNLSEGLQQSERGQNIESVVNELENAMQYCDGASDIEEFTWSFDADDIVTALDEAKA